MAILIRPGKRFRKARAGNGAEILKKLEDYLKTASSEPVELLCGFWKDQSNAITYQELRQAVLDGELEYWKRNPITYRLSTGGRFFAV